MFAAVPRNARMLLFSQYAICLDVLILPTQQASKLEETDTARRKMDMTTY